MKKILIERTKKGHPAIWEEGGGMTNTGFAQIVANPDGSPKHPVYIRRRGTLANAEHALFIVQPGDIIIQAEHHRGDFEIFVLRYDGVEQGEFGEYAKTTTLAHYSMGEWDAELPAYLQAAVEAAKEKATCYHCREPHFIEEDKDK